MWIIGCKTIESVRLAASGSRKLITHKELRTIRENHIYLGDVRVGLLQQDVRSCRDIP